MDAFSLSHWIILFLAAAGLAILISILIVLSLASEAVLFLTKIDLGQLTSLTWQPRADDWGIIALIAGTVQVALIAMLIATPLGLGAAIYVAFWLFEEDSRKDAYFDREIYALLAGLAFLSAAGFASLIVRLSLIHI